MKRKARLACALLFFFCMPGAAAAAEEPPSTSEEGDAELAQELTNPLADLMSIPVQMNYDQDIGPADDGWKLQTNIQPVIPFELSAEWNLISRTIMPVTYQEDIYPGAGSQFGLGDINLSLFLSPRNPTSAGLVWGSARCCCFLRQRIRCSAHRNGGPGPAGSP